MARAKVSRTKRTTSRTKKKNNAKGTAKRKK